MKYSSGNFKLMELTEKWHSSHNSNVFRDLFERFQSMLKLASWNVVMMKNCVNSAFRTCLKFTVVMFVRACVCCRLYSLISLAYTGESQIINELQSLEWRKSLLMWKSMIFICILTIQKSIALGRAKKKHRPCEPFRMMKNPFIKKKKKKKK